MFKVKGQIVEVYPEEEMANSGTRVQNCRFMIGKPNGKGQHHEIYLHVYNEYIDHFKLKEWIGCDIELQFFIKAKIYPATPTQSRRWFNNAIINRIRPL